MKRGRKPVYATEAEREAAKQAAQRRAKAKTKNVTIDSDLVDLLNAMADKLEQQFGFRPTLSQTVRHMIRQTDGGTQ